MAQWLIFLPGLLLEGIYLWLFARTIRTAPGRAAFRFWPPPSARSWQFFAAWIMAALVMISFALLGLLDFDSFVLPHFWARLPLALAFFVPGTLLGTWAMLTFGLRPTIGLGNQLIARGPYRFSRNPQYIGDSLNALGFIVLTNSWMAAVIGLLGVLLNLLAPLTEEPWLDERFGTDYRDYKRRVPRWL